MRSHFPRITSLAIVSLCSPLALAASPNPLPRYALPVGQKLTYVSTTNSIEESSTTSYTSTTELTVLHENPDGSRHLLIHNVYSYTTKREGAPDQKSPEESQTSQADIFLDGRRTPNPLGAGAPEPGPLVLLPPDEAALTSGWEFIDSDHQQTSSFKLVSQSPTEFVFSSTESGPMSRIYITTSDNTYHFDRSRGLITQIDAKGSQNYGFHSKSTGVTALKSASTITADQLTQLDADYTAFAAAQKKQTSDLWKKAGTDSKLINDAAGKIKSAIQTTADSVKTEDVKKLLADDLKEVDDTAGYYKQQATAQAARLNQPSPDWSSTDLDGHSQSISAYKGKVVVMDFWYRGCGWCMYATPAIRQLAEDYKDKPVVVLGMNTDSNEADARFVVKEFSLPYPIVKAKEIPEKYGIHGFPTLVLIDQSGTVRDFHVGYSPTLRADMSKKIDDLLAAAK